MQLGNQKVQALHSASRNHIFSLGRVATQKGKMHRSTQKNPNPAIYVWFQGASAASGVSHEIKASSRKWELTPQTPTQFLEKESPDLLFSPIFHSQCLLPTVLVMTGPFIWNSFPSGLYLYLVGPCRAIVTTSRTFFPTPFRHYLLLVLGTARWSRHLFSFYI